MNKTQFQKEGNDIILKGVQDFHPVHIFECGQAFRWKADDAGYVGIVRDKIIRIVYQENNLIFKNCEMDDYVAVWHPYFDFNRDYGRVKKELSKDKILKEAVRYGWGIRILNQDPWETLISFILSSNNNITRIKGIIDKLCICFGEPIRFEGKTYYTFPTAQALANASTQDLQTCGCGYRGPYIKGTASLILEGKVSLDALRELPYHEAREQILQCMGVGPKVADCILLFSLGKGEAFPVDVWVKRIMEYYYTQKPLPIVKIKGLSEMLFGCYAGLAQQYLFYYAREQKIGK